MGLASALAAQSGAPAAYGGASQPQGYPTPNPYPPASGYPPAAGAQQQMPPSQVPYGSQAQQAQQQGMASVIAAKLQKIVTSNQLHQFYPPERLHALTNRVVQNVDFFALAQRWRMPTELAVDLAALALYDIVIYADDSGSMESFDGDRIEDLKLIMSKVAEVATLFDDDGIEVRFINSDRQGNGIKNATDANRLLADLEYRWDTKLATFMEQKILMPMAYNKQLNKPLLIITITDGEPSDKPKDKIIQTILEARSRLAPRYGPGAVAFQFAQVGKDREAQDFLATLDKHPQVGNMIDCTSYYELESAEYAAKGINLSVAAWLVKLMVGAIDQEYDEQDEGTTAAAAGAGLQQQQQPYYGVAPQAPGYPAAGPAGAGYPAIGGSYPPQQQMGGYPQQQQQMMGGGGGGGYTQQQMLGSAYPPQQQQQYQGGAPSGQGKQKKGFFDKLFG